MAHASLSQDGFQRGGFWEVCRTYALASPFDLFQILPVGGGLLVLGSLPGPPVVKQLMQMVTVVPGQGGRFQSVVPLTVGDKAQILEGLIAMGKSLNLILRAVGSH